MKDKVWQDEIIAEVRAVREKLAARFDYDLDRLYEEAKWLEKASARKELPSAPKRIHQPS